MNIGEIPMGDRIFLAHGTSTAAEAERLSAELDKRGETVFLDSSVQWGENLSARLDEALNQAKAYVFLVRPDEELGESFHAEWRRVARRAAIQPDKKIVPVVLGGGAPPPFLRLWNAIEMTTDIEETSERVIHAVDAPGANEAPADSPALRPVVENWRKNLDEIERTVKALRPDVLEAESVE
jgi:hypothetical protein